MAQIVLEKDLVYNNSKQAKKCVYNDYKRNAHRKNRAFTITLEQFLEITAKPCAYSGIPASLNLIKHGKYRANINGIDRINSDGNYTLNNIVPCNSLVNRMKNDLKLEEFKFYVSNINKHLLGGK